MNFVNVVLFLYVQVHRQCCHTLIVYMYCTYTRTCAVHTCTVHTYNSVHLIVCTFQCVLHVHGKRDVQVSCIALLSFRSGSSHVNTQQGVGCHWRINYLVHSMMLSLSWPVYQVRLDWLPSPCIALIHPSQLSCLGNSVSRAS